MDKLSKYNIKDQRFLIHHHLGLGDHFVCNGIVNYISKITEAHISVICKQQNYVTVCCLYSEDKNISIIPIDTDCEDQIQQVNRYAIENDFRLLRFGFGDDHIDPKAWDMSFYKELGIDFIERYRSFKLPKMPPETLLPVPSHKYIFVHDESSEGKYDLKILSNLPQICVNKTDTDNILAYIGLIQNAEEIHCVNSSLFHLVDSMSNITKKLYYHDIRLHPYSFQVSARWAIIGY